MGHVPESLRGAAPATLLENVPECPICGSSRQSHFATAGDGGREVTYQACHRCGHVFQSPRMTEDELRAFYARGYRSHRQDSESPTEKDLQMQTARATTTLGLVEARVGSVSRHLDVGSSSGALLEKFRHRFGCVSVGVEPGEAYRLYSSSRGLQVVPSLDDLRESAAGPFDLVSLMHVLEHMPDPVAMLARLRSDLMTSDGFLLLEVPNLTDHQAFELAHAHAFTVSSLTDCVRRAGFRELWTRTHGSFRSPILRLYITLLARVAAGPSTRRPLPLPALRNRLGRAFGAAKRSLFTRYYPDWTWQSPEKVGSGGAPPPMSRGR
jgi:SAM-dependent methyltransferase